MISQAQIIRFLECHEYQHLVKRILANGRCRSAAVCAALCEPDAAKTAAYGLALQRVAELAYRPSGAMAGLADRMVSFQREDGFFTHAAHASDQALLICTAVAIRALVMASSQTQPGSDSTDRAVSNAIEHGLAALARCAADQASVRAESVAWSIVLWQLGDLESFRANVDVTQLLCMLDESDADLVEDELSRYAHAMAA